MDESLTRTNESSRALKTLDSIIRQGLARFAALYNVVPSEVLPGIWLDALKDLRPEIVASALLRIEREFVPTHACPFPVPANIRKFLSEVSGTEKAITAESAWQSALKWVTNEYHPDIAFSDAKQLEPKIKRALNSAGGAAHLYGCSMDDLQWSKKRFLEAFESLDRLEEDQFYLSDREAKKVLGSLMPADIQKKLVSGKSI